MKTTTAAAWHKYRKQAIDRQMLIRNAIHKACPIFLYRRFNICPVTDLLNALKIDTLYNDAYALLQTLHCDGYVSIPREIRKQIPDLIREAAGEPAEVTGNGVVRWYFSLFKRWLPFTLLIRATRKNGSLPNVWYDDGKYRLQGYRKYNPNEEFIEEWLGIFDAADDNPELKNLLEQVKVFYYLKK